MPESITIVKRIALFPTIAVIIGPSSGDDYFQWQGNRFIGFTPQLSVHANRSLAMCESDATR